MSRKPVVGVSIGDPAGIGPETIVKAYRDVQERADLVVVGDAAVVEDAIRVAGVSLDVLAGAGPEDLRFGPDAIPVIDTGSVDDFEYGTVSAAAGEAMFTDLERLLSLLEAGVVNVMVQGPIDSESMAQAERPYAEPMELFSARTGADPITTMLLSGPLRVSHVSLHEPLRRAVEFIVADRIVDVIELTADAVRRLGVERPTVAVAGANPHAGAVPAAADGLETDEIAPAVATAGDRGVDAVGPVSPDRVFRRAADGEFEAVVAMYHDQGHIPAKLLPADAGIGANLTLGLTVPVVTVSHGSAHDIAGTGTADPGGMLAAIRLAVDLAGDG